MAPDLMMPVSELKGVGTSVAKKLKKLKIETVNDLIQHYPRRYEDFSHITAIKNLKPGEVTVRGKITRIGTRRTRRRGFTITEAIIDDGTGAVKAVWFNQPYLAKTLPKGVEIFASGKLEFAYNQYALQNPVVERVSTFTKDTARIVPVYPETEGLSSRQIRGLIQQILPLAKDLPDILPPEIVTRMDLLTKAEALQQIHFPGSKQKLEQARKRLGFEELFELVLTGLVIHAEIKSERSPRIKFDETVAKGFVDKLPYKLTDAQRKAAWQILKDIDSETPMNRLLEGDVGSGKTVVAAMAAKMAITNGFQVALMAPTEILANQHFNNLEQIFDKSNLMLLTSSVKGSARQAITNKLRAENAGLVIGTHALLTENIEFYNLGLVIIDEQHRFGVNQRNMLKAKAGRLPHLLSMSATPIPRSLALTVYGDLDISIIDQMPVGRKKVITKVAKETSRRQVYAYIDEQIKKGRQVYVVCPLISESDKLGTRSVEAEAQRLKNDVFSHRNIGVLHGRMKADEKAAVMQKFKSGALDMLVSTTVVEVGVDVPNASAMLIEGAERFGLATLHQLRGRVGRAQHQSYCYVIASDDKISQERLKLLEDYNDGFALAQKDLELRGPGTIYGTAQHGLVDLRLADITDTKFVAKVREVAKTWLSKHKLADYEKLQKRINQLKTVTTLD